MNGELGVGHENWPSSVVIGAPQGRSGKTTISVGLCAVLKERGLVVQPFKKGPDYIDPSWLTAAANRNCRNLDTTLMGEDNLVTSFKRACHGTHIAVVEGAMGLYDSVDAEGRGSTAYLARLLHAPVILVVNTTRTNRSIAATVMGYQNFEPDTNIAGVILNNVAGSRHESKIRTAVAQHCGIPVLGSIPGDRDFTITQRHLGIIPYGELEEPTSIIRRMSHRFEQCLDLDGILRIVRSTNKRYQARLKSEKRKPAVVRIGVIYDRVFNFYYPENLEALSLAGAELVYIDSLQESKLPDVDGLYIGGGFPELFLKELEANSGLRRDIAYAIEHGLPVYAECAGLMYLCRSIEWQGERHEMVGVIPGDVELCQRPQGHGYVTVNVSNSNPLFPVGTTMYGHEFHYSKFKALKSLKFAYQVRRGHGIDGKVDAVLYKNVFAAYTHLHALGTPRWAEGFVSRVIREQENQCTMSLSKYKIEGGN